MDSCGTCGLRRAAFGAMALFGLLLAGCGRDMQDLYTYIAEVKMRQPPGIEPLPDIKPYEEFAYKADGLHDPFDTTAIARQPIRAGQQLPDGEISPDPNRAPEFLEGFPLDTLRMVGTLEQGGQLWALIKTPDATIERVAPGNFMGQNNGKITGISDAAITLVEIVPDGNSGWREREGQVALSE